MNETPISMNARFRFFFVLIVYTIVAVGTAALSCQWKANDWHFYVTLAVAGGTATLAKFSPGTIAEQQKGSERYS